MIKPILILLGMYISVVIVLCVAVYYEHNSNGNIIEFSFRFAKFIARPFRLIK